ncbi:MAG: energy transducer TonB [Candidatus Sulfotelmatobacter sp.]
MAAGGQARRSEGRLERSNPRYGVHVPLEVTVLRSGIADRVPGRSVDLSERGVAVVLAAELAAGEAVGLELQLPEQAQLQRWRAVVRYQDKLRCGMEFAGLSADQRAAIRDCTEKLKPVPELVLPSFRPFETLAEALAGYGKDDDERGKVGPGVRPVKSPLKSEEADARVPFAEDKSGGHGSNRTFFLLIFLVATCAILLTVFWVRWNRSWEELESGLPVGQEAANVIPQLQVPAVDLEKLIVHRVDPDYPAEARKANLQTVIALDVIVGKDGSVVSVRPLNGPDILARSAVDALRWWKFEPYRVNGAPAVVETTLAVEFKP